jgi:GNAT superfamily N-acetyltransferase
MCAGRKLHTAPQYSLHEGLYSRDPEQHAKYAAVYSPYLVVVSFNNELVGFCHPSLIYLMPEHRGKGLGKELFVQGFLLTGSKTFLEKTAKTRLTYAGLRSLKSAYRALVERGYLS